MEKQDWIILPGAKAMREKGYHNLVGAISRNGGYKKLRKDLGENSPRRSSGYWKIIDNVIDEARSVIEEEKLSELPSSRKLECSHPSLASAIFRYHGGFPAFRKKLNKYMERKSEKDQIESLLEKYANGKK